MPGKIKILVADEINLTSLKIFPIRKFKVDINIGISNDRILDDNYDGIIIRSIRKLDKKFIRNFSGNVIATCTKGTDHIDIEECRKRRIKVINSPEGNSRSAAEHTMAMILAASKNLLYSDRLVRNIDFKNLNYDRYELYGKKVGIIGYGSVGKKVAKLCKAFGMAVFVNEINKKVKTRNKGVRFKKLDYILKNCDIVTIHIPLNEMNYKLFDGAKLSLLKNDCIFVNTSRGGVIDENALITILKKKDIGFACLDVFEGEPDINHLFSKLSNVILSNHIAGKTLESKKRITEEICRKLIKYFNRN